MYNRYRRTAEGFDDYVPIPVKSEKSHPHSPPPPPSNPLSSLLGGIFGGGSRHISGFLKNMQLDSGDILLILIIVYMFIESDDDEIIIALALILLMGF